MKLIWRIRRGFRFESAQESTLEVVYPAVTLIRQTTRPFNFGFVTEHRNARALLDDLGELGQFNQLRATGNEAC